MHAAGLGAQGNQQRPETISRKMFLAVTVPKSTEENIDYAAVWHYFDVAGSISASTASFMAHEQNLPNDAVRYRLRKEIAIISDWLKVVPRSARVLDIGCGAGIWTEVLAKKFDSVLGLEQSSSMVAAARRRLTSYPHVEIVEGNVQQDLPPGPYDLIFLGGLCMYLNDLDVVALLQSLESRLAEAGSIILRETTIARGKAAPKGKYHAVYRSVTLYRDLFREAGFFTPELRPNYAYTRMEVAVELVEARRRFLRFLPAQSNFLGALTWFMLRGTAPLSFQLLPRIFSRLEIQWPYLQNHFFRLRAL